MPHFVALAVGRDSLLLQTRSQVLRTDGYTVVATLSSEEALQQFEAGDFDVVILCHSIPASERERLSRAMHSRSPGTPVVVVSRTQAAQQQNGADATVASDPEELLRDIPSVLGKVHPQTRHLLTVAHDVRKRA
jgi:CheY-like chemotaxis protein